ncbi:MAG: YcdB/YcdC domain-containing protein [Bacillota bacterium]
MNRTTRRGLASLLMTAILALPTGALASSPTAIAETRPAPMMPPPPPEDGGESDVLITPKLSRDEAIALVKQHFTIPAELGEPNVGIQQSREGAYWTLAWQSPSKQAERTRITANVDAVAGIITGYSRWTSGQEQPLELSFTRAEAKAMAQAWFEKLVPQEHRASLRYQESPLNAGYWGGSVYQFNWVREVHGFPLSGNGVHISIDARSGEMTQYGLSWRPNVELALPDRILSQEEAEEAYRKGVPMLLQYQRFQKRGTDESEWKLVYRPVTGEFPRIDQDGRPLGWQGDPLDLAALQQRVLVPASETPYAKPAQPLEMEEALAVARTLTGRTDAPRHSSYSEYGEETKRRAWDFAWATEAGEGRIAGEQRVRIDAETGLVTDYSHWSETKPFAKDEEVPVSLEEARETAIKFIRTYRPDLAGSLQLLAMNDRWENPDYRPTEYHIPFQQLKNGVPVSDRTVQVVVSARTGEVRNFWGGDLREEGEFPSPKPQIPAEKAMSIFLQQQGIEAAWFTFYSREKGEAGLPTFVWQPRSNLSIQAIDAATGVPMDWEGRNLIEAQRYPSDIKGHYAEREIELLWARGVFELQDGKFNPEMVISADELARWIVLARGLRPYMSYDFALLEATAGAGQRAAQQAAKSENSAYFGAALQSGIILPEDFEAIGDLNSPVTRELFALWAVRAMGYGRIAKMEARIEMGFADRERVGARYWNAVAILAGLKVVSGDGAGNFGPQQWLTRGQAAKILYAVTSAR